MMPNVTSHVQAVWWFEKAISLACLLPSQIVFTREVAGHPWWSFQKPTMIVEDALLLHTPYSVGFRCAQRLHTIHCLRSICLYNAGILLRHTLAIQWGLMTTSMNYRHWWMDNTWGWVAADRICVNIIFSKVLLEEVPTDTMKQSRRTRGSNSVIIRIC